MEQKRKVKSLLPVSKTGELGILSRFLIVLSCMFCFGTLLMLALCVSYVDAATPQKTVYSGGVEENAETLYKLEFVREGNLEYPEARIYMKSNPVGKNNLYMIPYPIMVFGAQQKPIGTNQNNLYLNFLGGEGLDIRSANISIIGGSDLGVNPNNSGATIFGGKGNKIEGTTSKFPRVIVGGSGNTVEGTNGVILGGEGDEVKGTDSFILGGGRNEIESNSNNAIVAGYNVTANKNNIFAYSNDFDNFTPKGDNAFYIDVQKGLGLKMNASSGVASSGAVSFGSIKGINCRENGNDEIKNENLGLIGLSGNCLYGCSEAGWQELGCFDQEWTGNDNISGHCVGPVYDKINEAKENDKRRYARCYNGNEEMYVNVAFETTLWTGDNCPDITGHPKNYCVYMCNTGEHYHYYTDPTGKHSGCKKDCLLPWNTSKYTGHMAIITGYSLTGVVCEEKENALGCEGKKAIMQCNDGKWVGTGVSSGTTIYEGNHIIYQYSGCTTIENKCNTGVYQYTNTGILNWVRLGNCTNHKVNNNLCETTNTVYSGRCYNNHTLTNKSGGKCQTGVDTSDCRCKPNQRTGDCLKTSFPDSHATAIKTGFIQTATGDKNEWDPSSKSYVPYSGLKPDAECTFKCDEGYSAYRNKNKKKYECLLNCEYNGITYENGQTISGYATGSVTCPNLCKPKNLTCHNGEWIGGTTGCFTTDEICSGYNFTRVIDHAKCDPCTKYKGSLEGICTTGDMVYSCECHYNPKDGYYVLSGSECVPATTGADCKGDEPIGSGNVTFPLGKTFKQTWSGGAHKWLPEEIKYHYGTGECGFFCNSGSSYIVSGNKCEGNECVNHNFGVEGSYHFYTPSSNGIVGKTNSVLYESGAEAQKAYGNGEKCIYFCNKCYDKKSGGLLGLGSPKCEPKTFTGTFWCKNNGNTGWLQAVAGKTQTFTYNVPTDVNGKCSDRTGYTFIGWSTNSGATSPMFTYGDKLTGGNYNSCSSTNFFAVYKCAQGYTGNGINCKKNSYVCTGTVPKYAELVPGSATGGLEVSTGYKLYEKKGDAIGKNGLISPCAYVCDSGHFYVTGVVAGKVVASCKKCAKASSTDQTICVEDLQCTNSDYPLSYIDEKSKTMQCTFEAQACKDDIPAHGYVPENYQYIGEPGDFGGIKWYCGKDQGKGCYFECNEGYECSVYKYGLTINDVYHNDYLWAPVSLGLKYYGRAVTTGNKCISKMEACTPFRPAVKNYKGELVHSDAVEQLYGGKKDWIFITGYNYSDVKNKMKANSGDCLAACYYYPQYLPQTGLTLSTYLNGDNETKFCYDSCYGNQYFSEDGYCESCPYYMKPDYSFTIKGNPVQCTGACANYERYDPDSDTCLPLCETGQYYSYYYGECNSCDGELRGWDDELKVFTECYEESQPSIECPDYFHKYGDGCVTGNCVDNQYLNRYGYCYTCNGKLTGWNESLGAYTGCDECTEGKTWNGSSCVYEYCGDNMYFDTRYDYCRSCASGKKPGPKKDTKYNNYTGCVNICPNGYVYRYPAVNSATNNYCWLPNVSPGCADGSEPIKASDGTYYCPGGYADE